MFFTNITGPENYTNMLQHFKTLQQQKHAKCNLTNGAWKGWYACRPYLCLLEIERLYCLIDHWPKNPYKRRFEKEIVKHCKYYSIYIPHWERNTHICFCGRINIS